MKGVGLSKGKADGEIISLGRVRGAAPASNA
jgi:hypothetical protein